MIFLHFGVPAATSDRDKLKAKVTSFAHIPSGENREYLEKIISKKHLPSVSESIAALEALDFLLTEKQILAKDGNGRPYAKGNGKIDFSLSHTKGLAACALVTGISNPRVGLDVERIYEGDPTALVNRFFSDGEKAYFNASGDKKSTFTLLWTRKEAYLKYTGTGIKASLSSFDVTSTLGVRFESFSTDGCIVTVCAKEKDFPLILK